ncbi:hypothetical protein LUZ62_080769 [Rhynchospora pubera]|uniref:Aminotransferase-like plant mobile domain-containing protein n=1 Tax=Rhynchospora pubera TaxID=906938 RepID=A0AAV8AUD4_9POAL|nr:hypothetical protein LUZ62_007151 [Rhynchospora pubera]KAJ4746364.1 hypothetical protein LUZ62_080769 [Rhynchospora pubera]
MKETKESGGGEAREERGERRARSKGEAEGTGQGSEEERSACAPEERSTSMSSRPALDEASSSRPRQRRRRNPRPNPNVARIMERQPDPENQQILFLTSAEHLIGLPADGREKHLDVRAHKRELMNDDRIAERLKNLGLIHISQVENVNLDTALLKAMIEFWRPETHTFHFPIGEMTVTLQDVAFLYGLRTVGTPVTGKTSGSWSEVVQMDLFPEANVHDWSREKKNVGHLIKLSWLRQKFGQPPIQGASVNELDRYTRAVALELFGTLMFPDSSQNAVPAYYLDLLRGDLNSERDYNWGAAVLAYLYRALDRASMRFKVVTGPWMLLLYWAWTRLPVCRPSVSYVFRGLPDIDSCPPFGRKWSEARSFAKSNHRGAVQYARDCLVLMLDKDVNWSPYQEDLPLMPRTAQQDTKSFNVRMPLIHYYVVSWYYPERCRHQFNLCQTVPPPLPIDWETMKNLLAYEHGTYRDGADWRSVFAGACARWDNAVLHSHTLETKPWSETDRLRYFRWYWRYGASELPTRREEAEARVGCNHGASLNVPVSEVQYTSQVPKARSQGSVALKNALEALAMVGKKGWRRIGKAILINCRAQLEDASMPFRMEDLLESRGLPTNIEDIEDSGNESSPPRVNIPSELQPEDLMNPVCTC